MGKWIYSSILNLGTRWKWTVSIKLRPLYPQGKSFRYLWDRRLGGLRSRSGLFGVEKHLAPAGNRTPAIGTIRWEYAELEKIWNEAVVS
jgi:hypothetical protein